MEPQAHFITFATADLDAARAFYRDGLGWQPLIDVPGEIIFFQIAPGVVLGLFDSVKFAEDLNRTGFAPRVSGVTLSHNVSSAAEVDETMRALAAAGATVLKSAQPSSFGGVYHGQIEDPNGIVWEIAHNPHWRVSESGAVSLS